VGKIVETWKAAARSFLEAQLSRSSFRILEILVSGPDGYLGWGRRAGAGGGKGSMAFGGFTTHPGTDHWKGRSNADIRRFRQRLCRNFAVRMEKPSRRSG
jgi:hypothetical protein